MLLLLIFLAIDVLVVCRWLIRRYKYKASIIETYPQLPKEIVTEILRYTFYTQVEGKSPVALHCTQVCKQWKKVIEQDLAHEWINRIRAYALEDQNKQVKIDHVIYKWKDVIKLAPKTISCLLRRRIAVFLNEPGASRHPNGRRREPSDMRDISELPNMGISQLPSWKVWHSGTRDPFEPIKYLKTCIFEPDWFTLLYTRHKKRFLSIMDPKTVSLGGDNYAWWFLWLHLLFMESLISIWILAWNRGNFLTNLWIPEDNIVSWQMSIYVFINFFAFVSMEISIGIWALIPIRLSSAICFGILVYGIRYILKSLLLMILAYAIGGVYYYITNTRDRPISELMACFAFILVYPALGIMLVICFVTFPVEDKTRKYFFLGLGLHLFSYLFYDPTLNFFRFIM